MNCESLLIEITQKCNLNCLYCFYRDYGRIENEISKNDITNILNKYNSVDNIYLTGGECTIAKERTRTLSNLRSVAGAEGLEPSTKVLEKLSRA